MDVDPVPAFGIQKTSEEEMPSESNLQKNEKNLEMDQPKIRNRKNLSHRSSFTKSDESASLFGIQHSSDEEMPSESNLLKNEKNLEIDQPKKTNRKNLSQQSSFPICVEFTSLFGIQHSSDEEMPSESNLPKNENL